MTLAIATLWLRWSYCQPLDLVVFELMNVYTLHEPRDIRIVLKNG